MFIAILVYVPLLQAQPYTQDEAIKPFQIILKEFKDSNGGLGGAARGTLATTPQYLFVKDLSVVRAVEVTLSSLTEGDSFKLEVAKNNWQEPVKSCEAESGSSCVIAFKTFSEAGFKITGSPNGSWQLAVFTSPNLDVSEIIPSPLFAAKRSDADNLAAGLGTSGQATDSSSSFLLMIIIALLAVIAVILFMFLFKRNKGHVAGVLLVVILGASSPHGEADGMPPLPPLPSPGEIEGADAATVIEDMNIDDKRVKTLLSLNKMVNSWQDLSSCSSMANRPGTPRIPTFCEDNPECTECYQGARSDFNFIRSVLEQLRIVYKCTVDYADDAIAFGDNVSGVHAVAGLAWQNERMGIKDSIRTLQGSYDNKYSELMDSLQKSMQNMNSCEAQWGVPDWYDRFGFIYMEFMSDKYRRTD
jgi:hypothetical protein